MLCPMLSRGAIEALLLVGSAELQKIFLPKMISGHWSGTMVLTEPQAGSDLGAIRTRALPAGDHYLVSGQKIFISYGDHDMTENIVHLVLARIEGAPAGVKGLSLFLVPKFIPDAAGRPGPAQRRALRIDRAQARHTRQSHLRAGLWRRDRSRGVPGRRSQSRPRVHVHHDERRAPVGRRSGHRPGRVCLAAGERVGAQPRAGAAGERARRDAGTDYPPPGRTAHAAGHAFGRRGDARTGAVRGAAARSGARGEQPRERRAALLRGELLIPIVKGWGTEYGTELVSLGLQVHGGMGYIEETGIAQTLRDVRITTIYEGTTAIQANDLLGRKLTRDGGAAMRALLDAAELELREQPGAAEAAGIAAVMAGAREGLRELRAATESLLAALARHAEPRLRRRRPLLAALRHHARRLADGTGRAHRGAPAGR